jgi:protein-disulfide isomerase
MNSSWRLALIGGLGGGLVAAALFFVALQSGTLPVRPSDAAFHDYLMAHPELVAAMQDKLQAEQDAAADSDRQRAVTKIGLKAFFNPRIAFITGPASAKNTLVEFFDYNCPYCRQSIPALKSFYARHKSDTRFAFIEFPIKGPQSTLAASAALAARNQPDRYLDFHFALMSESGLADNSTILSDAKKVGLDTKKLETDMRAPSIGYAIAQSHALADAAKIDGTPVFIVNGRIREGAVDDATLASLLKG